ncbi:hypothetical protein ACFUIV_27535 [Streptomyces anulatus]|uniref:hypothetical protein n=1 Tax=Streptomyces anulatus TaxID=1892 RepID=UPI003630FC25
MTRLISTPANSVCPTCQLIMEACTCTGVSQLTVLAPRAGVADEIGDLDDRSDDGHGYERDETERCFRELVEQLVDDGDDRAAGAGRRARRTLQEMAPGYVRQPVLILHRPTMGQCPLCERWNCPGHDCLPGVTATRPECKDLSDQQEREDLSKKVGEANKRSESRPK